MKPNISERAVPNIVSLSITFRAGGKMAQPGRVSKFEDKREELLSLIAHAQITHGRPPSIRSLAGNLDVGVATLHLYLTMLADEGLVEWSVGRHRTLRCTDAGMQAVQP